MNTPKQHPTPAKSAPGTSTSIDTAARNIVAVPDLDDLPEYMQKALEYLRDGLSDDPRWEDLIDAWVKFEVALGLEVRNGRVRTCRSYVDYALTILQDKDNRLPVKGRPKEVGTWIADRRDYGRMPYFTNTQAKAYGATWKRWWCALQPEWRDLSAWPPLNTGAGPKADWSALTVGGPNGIFLPLMALSWWVGATKGTNEESLQGAADMAQVLKHMSAAYAKDDNAVLGKRKGRAGDSGKGKRRAM